VIACIREEWKNQNRKREYPRVLWHENALNAAPMLEF
jgi:hypothetical protein